ncbi:MAG TPA: 2-oxo-4-hydroxy-4-carboxy-5-ureidoimidazoline decarboxylase [Microbacterium sp.]|uniref:2-oxo-4-hydroxy-4-carboxy-5-ureidoimidazoline decarboxylase n=1 Tax=Microbacterium sp. TaxID=51671 RepID=UPI002B55D47D|nr:2-oxo-4-hydroxy-4-carboxy-5-ureidoimidazoline decarboxylase [Microbacterium sp.]HWI30934.1 2-oxo-4-hydroxy-4-carboxy-5-ureidoimidazoline decarboxylase [Microbacterium sp.]
MELDEFDAAEAAAAASVVRVWADIPWWVESLVEARPYSSVDALADRAASLAGSWSPADLEAALAHHPRIGQPPLGDDAEAAASRSEQASMDAASADATARIAAGNAAYEERFGRVFLIRAAGRSPEQILSELERRLANDPDVELREATAQLAEIAILRLRATFADPELAAPPTPEHAPARKAPS